MQTRNLTLAKCHDSLNMLMQDLEDGCDNRNSKMFRCLLGTKYISKDADILKNVEFESGICHIQNGSTELMTENEKTACARLLLETDDDLSESSDNEEVPYEKRLRRRRWKRENPSGYLNRDFILGSAAEVERLWSIAMNVLTDE